MKEQHLEVLKALNEISDSLPAGTGAAPSRTRIISVLKQIMVVLMPEYFDYRGMSREEALCSFERELTQEVASAFSLKNESAKAEEIVGRFVESLPEIKHL
ncbi:MAG: hypothetical protein IKG97_04205, partial [Lachnospiraceae bacterium]|nr:hypothetical protein [Lachnospiraceae bacterium]